MGDCKCMKQIGHKYESGKLEDMFGEWRRQTDVAGT